MVTVKYLKVLSEMLSTPNYITCHNFSQGGGHLVCGITLLDNFSCCISLILISKCRIVVFFEPSGCGVLAFWMVLKIILLVL